MPIEFDCVSCQCRVRAPDSLAGQKARCPTCQAVLDVPDEVMDAEELPGAYRPRAAEPPAYRFEQGPLDPETGAERRRPCPMCGEMIVTSAVKCRFCGEIFDPALRKKAVSPDDEDLSALDWTIALLCGGIGCIPAIVYMIQGKSKGPKMMLVSICSGIFWAFFNVLLTRAGR